MEDILKALRNVDAMMGIRALKQLSAGKDNTRAQVARDELRKVVQYLEDEEEGSDGNVTAA